MERRTFFARIAQIFTGAIACRFVAPVAVHENPSLGYIELLETLRKDPKFQEELKRHTIAAVKNSVGQHIKRGSSIVEWKPDEGWRHSDIP